MTSDVTNLEKTTLSVGEIVGQLLSEDFAKSNGFGDISLLRIGDILESSKDVFETPLTHSRNSDFIALRNSFENCKEAFCLLLMQLEASGAEWDWEDSPSDLSLNDTKTIIRDQVDLEAIEETNFDDVPVSPTSFLEEDNEVTILKPRSELNPLADSASMTELTEELGTLVQHNLSQEYVAIYDHLNPDEHPDALPVTPPIITKLRGQSLCFALENEVLDRVLPHLKPFWRFLEPSVRLLFNPHAVGGSLRTEIREAIAELAIWHKHWLFEEVFPHGTLMNSLRYMLSQKEGDTFTPTLFQTGIVVFFFGQETQLKTFSLKNHLGLSGLSHGEITEFFFRLSRVQKMRKRILDITSVFQPSQLDILENDMRVLLGLMRRMIFVAPGVSLENPEE